MSDGPTGPLVCCGADMICRDSRPYENKAGNVNMRKIIVFLRRRRYRCVACKSGRTTLELDYHQAAKMLANEKILVTLLAAMREATLHLGDG